MNFLALSNCHYTFALPIKNRFLVLILSLSANFKN